MNVFAIDPGTTESAVIRWRSTEKRIVHAEITPNEMILFALSQSAHAHRPDISAIEMVACYGMAVGKEVFETCVWIGRFFEHLNPEPRLIYRRDVKMHHCQSARAKDANVRQALIDKYGAPGTKKNPGVTYGLKSHLWQAFAIATFISETATAEPASHRSNVEDSGRTPGIAGVPPVCAAGNLSLTS